MSATLLLVCNSRRATIGLHELDRQSFRVSHVKDVRLPVPSGENSASPMVFSRDGRMLYLAWRGADRKLLSFAFDAGAGDLKLLDSCPLADDIAFLTLDAGGDHLLGAGGESVVSIPLLPDARPQSTQQRVVVGPLAHCVIPISDHRVLATSCSGDLVRVLAYERPSEKLLPAADLPQPAGSGPRHLCGAPDGGHVYMVTQESGEVVVFECGTMPQEVQRLPLLDRSDLAPMGGHIAVTPNGRFLYASERTGNSLVGYAIHPKSGLLERIGDVAVPDYPRAFAIDESGDFLVVAGYRGHRAVVLAIASDGTLAQMADFATGERPSWVLTAAVT